MGIKMGNQYQNMIMEGFNMIGNILINIVYVYNHISSALILTSITISLSYIPSGHQTWLAGNPRFSSMIFPAKPPYSERGVCEHQPRFMTG
jgi:hypothetical protein